MKITRAAQAKPSANLGPVPKFSWLALDSLVIDERYQRRVTDKGIALIYRIVREFSWTKLTPLVVTGPDASGDYPVIDGQHRLEAARRHAAIKELPCWIVAAPQIAEQAQSFVAVNKNRIAVTSINVFWAALASGDPEAKWMKSIVDKAGIAIGRVGNCTQPPLTTIALGALRKLKPYGDDVLVACLKLIAEAQPEAENAFRSASIAAVATLLVLCPDLDRKRLATVLADMDLDHEIERAAGLREFTGGSREKALQAIFAKAYNKGLRSGPRLPE